MTPGRGCKEAAVGSPTPREPTTVGQGKKGSGLLKRPSPAHPSLPLFTWAVAWSPLQPGGATYTDSWGWDMILSSQHSACMLTASSMSMWHIASSLLGSLSGPLWRVSQNAWDPRLGLLCVGERVGVGRVLTGKMRWVHTSGLALSRATWLPQLHHHQNGKAELFCLGRLVFCLGCGASVYGKEPACWASSGRVPQPLGLSSTPSLHRPTAPLGKQPASVTPRAGPRSGAQWQPAPSPPVAHCHEGGRGRQPQYNMLPGGGLWAAWG